MWERGGGKGGKFCTDCVLLVRMVELGSNDVWPFEHGCRLFTGDGIEILGGEVLLVDDGKGGVGNSSVNSSEEESLDRSGVRTMRTSR